jgi:hypothetical protein
MTFFFLNICPPTTKGSPFTLMKWKNEYWAKDFNEETNRKLEKHANRVVK